MQQNRIKKFLLNSFFLSILLHLLLLLFLGIHFYTTRPIKKPPHYYVPAYVYKGAIKPSSFHAARRATNRAPQAVKHQAPQQTSAAREEASQPVFPKPRVPSKTITKQAETIKPRQSLLAASFQALAQQTQREIMESAGDAEPIYLVGDENEVADPIIKLIGRALSAHFEYPETAGRLGIQGRAIIAMTLHPDGHFSHVQMLRSSNSQDLDSAALYAVNTAPRVKGADRFLTEPKRFVVGFIFK